MRCIFEGTCNSDTDCTITGETCDATSKKCMCGTAESCKGNTATPTCDAGNNQCVAATDPAACNTDTDCTVTGEKCAGTSKNACVELLNHAVPRQLRLTQHAMLESTCV